MAGTVLDATTAPDGVVRIELSVRVIPFAVSGGGLSVALLQQSGENRSATLPAGQLRHGESLTDCAARVAREALSIPPDYLEQLYTFSVA